MFFVSPAFAADTVVVAADVAEKPGLLSIMAPLILVFFVFYVLVIRPQNKRIQEHRKTVNELAKGTKVVTGGGVIATVKKLEGDDEIILEIAPGVEVRALRHSIMMVRK